MTNMGLIDKNQLHIPLPATWSTSALAINQHCCLERRRFSVSTIPSPVLPCAKPRSKKKEAQVLAMSDDEDFMQESDEEQ